ncbi:CLUMA_CG006373, isoform A [Clunio marinus]|uniref:CLUMA_CG006373, isoform A n=1 Tax=Clunio marinus TaxID=568069 RepID=A0A1J1HY53_9DIPT|nr:CLUMA_CG006373, isoform A [Clunio marinus]
MFSFEASKTLKTLTITRVARSTPRLCVKVWNRFVYCTLSENYKFLYNHILVSKSEKRSKILYRKYSMTTTKFHSESTPYLEDCNLRQ